MTAMVDFSYENERRRFARRARLIESRADINAEDLERLVEEIQAQKLELERQNRELLETKAKLEGSQRLLKKAHDGKAEALGHAQRELEHFVYAASHDLQEPLRKIMAFSDRLKLCASSLGEGERFQLDRIQNAALRMKRLIEDLLNFSRVAFSEGRIERVDLNEVVAEILQDLEIRIMESEARFEIGRLPVIPATRLEMRQLFRNLIQNALKFTREGVAPLIRITSREVDGSAEITVEDNGIGFDEKYLDRIFRPFQKLQGFGEGTGVGLAVCQRIVHRYFGSLTAQSRPGSGSRFTVTLPLTEESDEIKNI